MSIKNIVNILSLTAALCGSFFLLAPMTGCARTSIIQQSKPQQDAQAVKKENLIRSMALIDQTMASYFHPETFRMSRFYNPFTHVNSNETASVWMYSAGIEAINAVLSGLESAKAHGDQKLYEANFSKYETLLEKMYAGADYYLGTFELTSFTQTKEWSVYAVDRVQEKGTANVKGILNVYDDQMWLVRELLDSYKLTGNQDYLAKAEYLTSYVLDGWDVTLDENGQENGGIPWGPGYTTKHACSNSPLISSLVWLHTIYKGKEDQIEHRFINAQDRKTRITEQQKKEAYYLNYAKLIYDWQKEKLLATSGVYTDMMGGCDPNCDIVYEEVAGKKYRANTKLTQATGEAFSYNSGTMISGAVDLFNATNKEEYLKDAETLGNKSFNHFTSLGKEVPQYYSFETNGFKNWFNGILM
ncbi:MAG: glycoside hydrolase family 76 protein, partial [Sphingobacterium sp.]